MSERQDERCCFCGEITSAGIYTRADPQKLRCRGEHERNVVWWQSTSPWAVSTAIRLAIIHTQFKTIALARKTSGSGCHGPEAALEVNMREGSKGPDERRIDFTAGYVMPQAFSRPCRLRILDVGPMAPEPSAMRVTAIFQTCMLGIALWMVCRLSDAVLDLQGHRIEEIVKQVREELK